MEKQDIEILKILMKKAKERELGVSSIIYYYALKHAIEELEGEENGKANRAEAADSQPERSAAERTIRESRPANERARAGKNE